MTAPAQDNGPPHASPVRELPGHLLLSEPELAFHPERTADRSAHPLAGLLDYGPYSRATINAVLDPIRIATIAPANEGARIRQLLAEFEMSHEPQERKQYLRPFPGFQRVFGVRLVAAGVDLELPTTLDQEFSAAAQPHLVLAERLGQALSTIETKRSDFDVLLIYLPDRWEPGFEERNEDFDLHDHLKAITAMRGTPTQIVREGSAISYSCRASVMWRLGIAIYTKAGGVPWKLADADRDTAYIGLSYALRPETAHGSRFVICCSQVFDADGAGLEFIAYETDKMKLEHRKNPFLSQAEMRRVMARSLRLYQQRHAGRPPRRVVVHKTTEFKREEVEGCFDALAAVTEIELVQVKQSSGWRGIKIEGQKQPAGYPIQRGSLLQLGGREVLLWTQGTAAEAVAKNFFKEGKGIPAPLELVRFAGHGGWEEHCRATLGLTKMNWNNDSLYDRLPITLSYAKVLAQTIKRIPKLAPSAYPFRLFM